MKNKYQHGRFTVYPIKDTDGKFKLKICFEGLFIVLPEDVLKDFYKYIDKMKKEEIECGLLNSRFRY